MPVKVEFDIANSPGTKEVWAHKQSRILAALWRPCHLANQFYWEETLRLGKVIEERDPANAEELRRCFGWEVSRGPQTNYTDFDLDSFAVEAFPFFSGEKEIRFEFPKKTTGAN